MTISSLPKWRRVFRVERILLPILIMIVLVLAALFYSDWSLLRDSRIEVARIHRVIQKNEMVVSALKDLETGQRGYLLTGNPEYLEPYKQAKKQLPELLNELRSEVRYPDQIARIERLSPLINEKLAEMEATLLVRDQLGPNEALEIVRTNRGKVTMDALRQLGDEIRTFAFSLMLAASDDLEARSLRSRFGVLAGCSILVSLLLLSLGLIHRATARRESLVGELDNAGRQFQTTLASIGDGVITTDRNGLVTFLNPIAEQLSGWSSDEAKGSSIESVFHIVNETTGDKTANPVRQVLRDLKIVGMANHTNLVRRDGTAVPIDDSAAPILDSESKLIGAVMVFRDVTSRRAVDQALSRWQHVFDHAGFGMIVLTPGKELIMEHVNPAFAVMHGYALDDLKGKSYSTVVDPELWPAKSKKLDGSSAHDHLLTETVHLRKSGAKFPALTDFTVVRNAQKNILYYTGYCSDVSDRKRTEEELRQSEERYRVTADSLPQLIWSSKADGTTEYLNNRWHEETGFTLEQTGHEGWSYFLAPEDREECLNKWKAAIQTGETFQSECRFKTPHKEGHRWYSCRAVPVRDSSGRVIRWFGSCTDIHEQRLAADVLRISKEELQLANDALRRSNQDLEQFAYAASHDLQEPLRMVAIYSQLLHEEYAGKLEGEAMSYLKYAVDGAHRMEALLKDLLAYSRASDDQEVPLKEISSQDALAKALKNLTASIQEAGGEVSRTALPNVRIPEVHLVQVFQNLVGNAIKYRKPAENPVIHIDAKPHEGVWIFSVKDNGIGIAPEYQDQVFRVFGRLHGQEVPGTGIGLAICKKVIERIGGSIWVESAVGVGSTFYFTVRA